MKHLLLRALPFIFLTACSPSSTPSSQDNATHSNESAATASPTKSPEHNFAALENGLYLYPQALTEEDKKAGIASTGFVGFKYLGFRDGLHILQPENAGYIMACETECIVIKQMINGKVIDRLQYSPNTIIGAAFDDAKAGYLASPDALIPKEASEINSAHRILTPADRTRETARLKQSEADAKKADELIKAYFPEYENCRGGADGAEITISACAEKEVIASKLKAMGYCISGVSPGWSKC